MGVLPVWEVLAAVAWHEQAELLEQRGQADSVDRRAILAEVMSVRLGAGPEPLDRRQWFGPISTTFGGESDCARVMGVMTESDSETAEMQKIDFISPIPRLAAPFPGTSSSLTVPPPMCQVWL